MAMITYSNGVRFDAAVADIFGNAYLAALGRAPVPSDSESANDPGGLLFWVNQFLGGTGSVPDFEGDVGAIGDAFLTSPEYTSRFGSDLTPEQHVDVWYNNFLGRPPSASDIAFWGDLIRTLGPGEALMAFANTDEFSAVNTDAVASINSWIVQLATVDPEAFAPDPSTPESAQETIGDTEGQDWLDENPNLDPVNEVFNVGSSDVANFAKQPIDPNGYLLGSDFGQDIVTFDLNKPIGNDIVLGMILANKGEFDPFGNKQGDIVEFLGVSNAEELAGMIASVTLEKDLDASTDFLARVPGYRYETFFADKDFWDMTVTLTNGDTIQFIDFIADDAEGAIDAGLTEGTITDSGEIEGLIGILEANDNVMYG